jgi:preprotein translocase subunit SecG
MSHPWTDVFSILFAIASLFLIFIVLLQRGRGGGLAGAFGATGGQSAFGTKAGDIFTRITIGVAVVWVALAAGTGFAMRAESKGHFQPLATGDETQLIPGNPPAGAGGNANPFEAGDQGTKSTPATKGATGKESKAAPTSGAPASGAPAKSSSSVTPPSSTLPASNAKPTPAPSK